MFELKEDSVRVVDGKLCRCDGDVIKRPAILVYGNILVRVGNYTSLFKEMLELQKEKGVEGFDIHILNLSRYPKEYFDVYDACYVIRRCSELLDESFINYLVNNYGNVGFLDWFESEKFKTPIQTVEGV